MKRLNSIQVLMAASAVVSLAALSACKDFDFDEATGRTQLNELKKDYDKAFAEQFGTYGQIDIDPTHDWGFKEMTTVAAVSGQNATRSWSDPDANEWGGYIEVPAPLTQEQKDVVSRWFNEHKNPEGVAINYSDYFVQQVFKGNDQYQNAENTLVVGSDQMDQLTDAQQHQFNYNHGDMSWNNEVWDGSLYNPNDPNSRIFHSDQIMLVRESSTAYFQYYNSLDSKWHPDCYVIIPGDRIDPIVAGMYFVGFDYYANGEYANMQVERDYYFDDWIVRITPGVFKNTETTNVAARIMCEDLGTTDDFDFNDVVFDVTYTTSTNALITLRAAGGTMPLYIGDPNNGGREVHELFGVDTKTMVNTNSNTVSRPIVQFNLEVSSTNPIDIPVVVYNTMQKNAINYVLDASPGAAPRKICVDTWLQWADERVNFGTLYPNFRDWIKDSSNTIPQNTKKTATLIATPATNSLTVGANTTITIEKNSSATAIVTSRNMYVATVDGLTITALNPGTATIAVYTPANDNYEQSSIVTFEVTVTAAEDPQPEDPQPEDPQPADPEPQENYGQSLSTTYRDYGWEFKLSDVKDLDNDGVYTFTIVSETFATGVRLAYWDESNPNYLHWEEIKDTSVQVLDDTYLLHRITWSESAAESFVGKKIALCFYSEGGLKEMYVK